MLRRLCLTFIALLAFAVCSPHHALAQTDATPAASSGDDVNALKTENEALKKEVSDAQQTIAQLQAKLAAAAKAPPAPEPTTEAAGTAPAAAPMPAGPLKALPLDAPNPNIAAMTNAPATTEAGPSRSYTVVKGDSIWKIAHKMYPGDTKNGVEKIQEANKDAIGGKPLKIGQVLVIPQ